MRRGSNRHSGTGGADLPLLVLESMVPEEGRRGLVLFSLSGVIGATCDQLSFDQRGRFGQRKKVHSKAMSSTS